MGKKYKCQGAGCTHTRYEDFRKCARRRANALRTSGKSQLASTSGKSTHENDELMSSQALRSPEKNELLSTSGKFILDKNESAQVQVSSFEETQKYVYKKPKDPFIVLLLKAVEEEEENEDSSSSQWSLPKFRHKNEEDIEEPNPETAPRPRLGELRCHKIDTKAPREGEPPRNLLPQQEEEKIRDLARKYPSKFKKISKEKLLPIIRKQPNLLHLWSENQVLQKFPGEFPEVAAKVAAKRRKEIDQDFAAIKHFMAISGIHAGDNLGLLLSFKRTIDAFLKHEYAPKTVGWNLFKEAWIHFNDTIIMIMNQVVRVEKEKRGIENAQEILEEYKKKNVHIPPLIEKFWGRSLVANRDLERRIRREKKRKERAEINKTTKMAARCLCPPKRKIKRRLKRKRLTEMQVRQFVEQTELPRPPPLIVQFPYCGRYLPYSVLALMNQEERVKKEEQYAKILFQEDQKWKEAIKNSMGTLLRKKKTTTIEKSKFALLDIQPNSNNNNNNDDNNNNNNNNNDDNNNNDNNNNNNNNNNKTGNNEKEIFTLNVFLFEKPATITVMEEENNDKVYNFLKQKLIAIKLRDSSKMDEEKKEKKEKRKEKMPPMSTMMREEPTVKTRLPKKMKEMVRLIIEENNRLYTQILESRKLLKSNLKKLEKQMEGIKGQLYPKTARLQSPAYTPIKRYIITMSPYVPPSMDPTKMMRNARFLPSRDLYCSKSYQLQPKITPLCPYCSKSTMLQYTNGEIPWKEKDDDRAKFYHKITFPQIFKSINFWCKSCKLPLTNKQKIRAPFYEVEIIADGKMMDKDIEAIPSRRKQLQVEIEGRKVWRGGNNLMDLKKRRPPLNCSYSLFVPRFIHTKIPRFSNQTCLNIFENRRDHCFLPLEIKKSIISCAGLGIFATERLEKDRIVMTYMGKIKTHYQIQASNDSIYSIGTVYAQSPIVLSIDAFDNGNAARYINGGTARTSNCQREIGVYTDPYNGKAEIVVLITTKAVIEAGQQLFYQYGGSYWKNLKSVENSEKKEEEATKNKKKKNEKEIQKKSTPHLTKDRVTRSSKSRLKKFEEL